MIEVCERDCIDSGYENGLCDPKCGYTPVSECRYQVGWNEGPVLMLLESH